MLDAPLPSPLRASPRLAARTGLSDATNLSASPSPQVAAKKVRKRRKSVGPTTAHHIFAADDEEDAKALRFELDNALADNEELMEQLMEARNALTASEAECARLREEVAQLKQAPPAGAPPVEEAAAPSVDARTALGLSARICGIGPLSLCLLYTSPSPRDS